MTEQEARDIVAGALTAVAPELAPGALDPEATLRGGADLDSMDFLAFVAAVSEAIGKDIPEAAYAELDGIAKAGRYVLAHATAN